MKFFIVSGYVVFVIWLNIILSCLIEFLMFRKSSLLLICLIRYLFMLMWNVLIICILVFGNGLSVCMSCCVKLKFVFFGNFMWWFVSCCYWLNVCRLSWKFLVVGFIFWSGFFCMKCWWCLCVGCLCLWVVI